MYIDTTRQKYYSNRLPKWWPGKIDASTSAKQNSCIVVLINLYYCIFCSQAIINFNRLAYGKNVMYDNCMCSTCIYNIGQMVMSVCELVHSSLNRFDDSSCVRFYCCQCKKYNICSRVILYCVLSENIVNYCTSIIRWNGIHIRRTTCDNAFFFYEPQQVNIYIYRTGNTMNLDITAQLSLLSHIMSVCKSTMLDLSNFGQLIRCSE